MYFFLLILESLCYIKQSIQTPHWSCYAVLADTDWVSAKGLHCEDSR